MVYKKEKILIIRHGALGDFILSTGPFKAIRAYHQKAHIILLTTKPFEALAQQCPFFDEVWVDSKPKIYHLFSLIKLMKRILDEKFYRIYDLQTSSRTRFYYQILHLLKGKKLFWSGDAKGCRWEDNNPHRCFIHTIERQKYQLQKTGIRHIHFPDLSWLKSDLKNFQLPERFCLMVPGGSVHRSEKRWSKENYAQLAVDLVEKKKIIPVVIGTDSEKDVLDFIQKKCQKAIILMGKTSFADVAQMARIAKFSVGNDTGPMHIIASAGCQENIVLFSLKASNPKRCAPRGKNVKVLSVDHLSMLSVKRVFDSI